MLALVRVIGLRGIARIIWRYAPGRPRRIEAIVAHIRRLLPAIEDDVADRYSGCGWSDDTERHLLDDIFYGQSRRSPG